MRTVLTLVALMVGLVSQPATAGPMVDFSLGTLGDVGNAELAAGGTVVIDAHGGTLFRFGGFVCCEHDDYGFGVQGPGQGVNAKESELDAITEFVRVSLLPSFGPARVTAFWFSSMNGNAEGQVYAALFPVGNSYGFTAAEALSSDALLRVPIVGSDQWSRVFWIGQRGNPVNNAFNVWGFDYERELEAVPEPTTLALMSIGLLAMLRSRQRERF